MGDGRLAVLVLSTFDGTDANVCRDFLFSFNAHSRHEYRYVFDCRILDARTDFSAFDVIVIFWTVDLLGVDISEEARENIARSGALKVLFLQDEYRDVYAIDDVAAQLGVQVVFTCVAETDHATFYSPARIPTLCETVTILPGYVPRYVERSRAATESDRTLDVSYRSRAMPYYLGDLGQDKRVIAEQFQAASATHGLRSDISVREEDRLYGDRWLNLLRSSRCVLGTPSGASVVDFTGEIRRQCERYLALNPAASYDEVKRLFFASRDWEVVIDTVSPRVFEAAGFGCTMVHQEGRYAGILEPGRHYIAIKRDYSNLMAVVEQIKDAGLCREVATNAYRDLIASGAYTYAAFAARFDGVVERHRPRPVRSRSTSVLRFYARNYLRHGQAIIPYRDRFRVAPSAHLAFDLIRRALAIVPARRYGPIVSRILRNPGNVLVKGFAAWRLAVGRPLLRTILGEYFRVRNAGPRIPAFAMLADLLMLDIIDRARKGALVARQPFAVSVDFDPRSAVVTLTSRAPGERGEDGVPDALPAALAAGGVSRILWDHSGFAQQVVYAVKPRHWLTVGLKSSGIHLFDALAEVGRRAPGRVAPALLSILQAEAR